MQDNENTTMEQILNKKIESECNMKRTFISITIAHERQQLNCIEQRKLG